MARVDPRAVLEGRVPGRPSIGLVLGLLVSSVCVLLALGVTAIGGAGFAVGVLLAILPVPVLIALILALDRLEPEPPRVLVFAFLWGAGVAVLIALILNTAGMVYLTVPIFGEQGGHFVSATFGAPLVEESLKGAVLFILLWTRRQEIDGFADGLIYAGMVAVGFAMMENITYYMRAYQEGAEQLQAIFILRGVIAPLSHPLFTAMTGLGVAYAATRRGPGRVIAPIAGLLAAMTLHGLWNGSTTLGLGGLAVVYVLDAVVLIILVIVVAVERRNTVQLIGRFLPMYAPTGLVTQQDVQMLGRMSSRRSARRWARGAAGAGGARAMGDYQLAATELALIHKRAERGTADPAWFAHRRDALLTLMADARQAFLGGPVRPPAPPWAGAGQSGFGPAPQQAPNPGQGQQPYQQAYQPYGQMPYPGPGPSQAPYRQPSPPPSQPQPPRPQQPPTPPGPGPRPPYGPPQGPSF